MTVFGIKSWILRKKYNSKKINTATAINNKTANNILTAIEIRYCLKKLRVKSTWYDSSKLAKIAFTPFAVKKIDKIKQKIALDNAKYWLEKKFSGQKTIENKISGLPKDSPFKNKVFKQRVLEINNKKKVLIAAHHFSDAPHAFGEQIFSDYFEGIEFLGKKSEDSDYDWYVNFNQMEFKENKKKTSTENNKQKTKTHKQRKKKKQKKKTHTHKNTHTHTHTTHTAHTLSTHTKHTHTKHTH